MLLYCDYGYINWFRSLFGIAPVEWLTDSNKVIWTLIIFSVWSDFAFKTVLFLTGLQKIDTRFYSSAKMDGAGPIKILSPMIWILLLSLSCFFGMNMLYS